MDCIFCKIVAGQIPCFKIHEDAETLAFMDINPLTEGHALVIPKRHCTGLFDAPPEALAAVARAAQTVALGLRKALGLDSLNLVQANGPWAAQSVPHLHLHLIPRREKDGAGLDWALKPGDMSAIQALADRVAKAVARA